MKLIESKVELIEQQPGLEGVYKQIELAGRTCYKSEDKITEDSAKEFVDRMIKSKHGAVLEHGTVYLEICANYDTANQTWNIPQNFFPFFFERNKYSKVKKIESEDICNWYITTNMRVIVENNLYDCLKYVCEPTAMHEKRISAKFTIDRINSQSIVRHRTMSFTQESQRFCNYSKSKFNNEVTFVKPHWFNEESPASLTWIEAMKDAEKRYFELIEMGLKPQDARGVLPNETKTEIVVTGFESDWEHFFSLRSPKYGAQGPHPNIAKLADELYEKLNNVNTDNKTE